MMKSQGFKIGGVGSPKNEFLRLGISDSGVFEGAESSLVVRFPIKSIVRVEERGEGCVFGKIDFFQFEIAYSGVFGGAEGIFGTSFQTNLSPCLVGIICLYESGRSWEHKICVRWCEIGAMKVQDMEKSAKNGIFSVFSPCSTTYIFSNTHPKGIQKCHQ